MLLMETARPRLRNVKPADAEVPVLRITNACAQLDTVFPDGRFSMDAWVRYIDAVLPDLSGLFIADVAKYDFEQQCLPVICNALNCHDKRIALKRQDKRIALKRRDKRAQAIASFEAATEGLDGKIRSVFNRDLDADIILCLGLCSGAGWVTALNGRTVVLLGIEKIIELDWCSQQDMYGLIYHELGHVYQAQFGISDMACDNTADGFIWQLFTEGAAMCFEQMLVGDAEFYHQDKAGWKSFMDAHFDDLKQDFSRDVSTMDRKTQRYFGDWASYHGFGDAGYYLGARFVRFIMTKYAFDRAISLSLAEVKALFYEFTR